MMTFIFFVLVVLTLLLLIQARQSHHNIKEGLTLTREIHAKVLTARTVSGEVVDKHVAINKAETEKLSEAVRNTDGESNSAKKNS